MNMTENGQTWWELDPRTRNCLALEFGEDFNKAQVSAYTFQELLRLPNFGRKSLADVRAWLKDSPWRLAGDPQPKPPADIDPVELLLLMASLVLIVRKPSAVKSILEASETTFSDLLKTVTAPARGEK